jgi:predicted GNAT family acetyltransferase
MGGMSSEVRDNAERSRYELLIDGEVVGVADYRVTGDQVVMPHTEIAGQMRGQGLGAVLVRGALDDLIAKGKSVVPQCWYVAEFIDDHPDYKALLRTA